MSHPCSPIGLQWEMEDNLREKAGAYVEAHNTAYRNEEVVVAALALVEAARAYYGWWERFRGYPDPTE